MNERFYLTVQEVMEQLQCCDKAVYQAIEARQLRAFRPPGTRRWLITPEDLRVFVEGKPVLHVVDE